MMPPPLESLVRMRAFTGDLPRQFAQGFSDGTDLARACQDVPDCATFVVGMGGSGAAGEFVQALVRRESAIYYDCLHTPELPAAVGPSSRVILLSYSGNTWEVLQAGDEARRRGARRVVVTSGGALRRRAEKQGDALLLLPPDLPPRSAIGFTFGGLLGFLDSSFPESLEGRVAAARSALEVYRGRVDGRQGATRRIVDRLGNRMPIIYGEPALAAVARRWAGSLEENAKRLAAVDTLPEALHNALVGWDSIAPTAARRLAGIILDWGGASPQLRRTGKYLGRALERKGARVVRVSLPAEDLLEALLEGIMLGDFVSLAIAERAGTDPLPLPAIDRYRSFMALQDDRPSSAVKARRGRGRLNGSRAQTAK